MSEFDAWIGREQRATDWLDKALAAQWFATFALEAGYSFDVPSIMGQGIHFALCTPENRTVDLGDDGHPLRNDDPLGFLPPIPMPRRMWASSKIEFHEPLLLNAAIERISRIASISEKEGASGRLAFVDIKHRTLANGIAAVTETQTLVYRDAAAPDAPLSPPRLGESTFDPSEWDAHRTVIPDSRLLFRFSALTFNTHRIHYDMPYAREVERYRGLVVHGPLTASLLLKLAARKLGKNVLRTFAFRGVSPAIAGEPLHLVMRKADDGYEMGAFADDGRQVTKASATV